MEIKYLKDLRDNPTIHARSHSWTLEPMPETEIVELEKFWNQGNPFPVALRELLYLAGHYCYVLDYGIEETMQELQEFVREEMVDHNKTIARPFFVIDVYNAATQFLFVYLDENDDPAIYQGYYSLDVAIWITLVSPTLSNYINSLIKIVKSGQNPF